MVQLVMIEWEDSAQPASAWRFLHELTDRPLRVVRCISVGWLVYDGNDVKALAPNMGDLENEEALQVSGLIRIPACCIVKISRLKEPKPTFGVAVGLSSRPVTRQTPRASSRPSV